MNTSIRTAISTVLLFTTLHANTAMAATSTYDATDATIESVGLGSAFNGWSTASSSGSFFYDYVAVNFTVDTTGTYSFGQTAAPVDTVMAVYYNGAFDINALVNADGYNDDGSVLANSCGSAGLCPELTGVTLTAGQTNTMVISLYDPSVSLSLPLSFFADGPGLIVFTVSGTAYFVPVSSTINSNTASMLDDLADGTLTASAALSAALTTLTALSDSEREAALQHITAETSVALSNTTSQIMRGSMDQVGSRLSTRHASIQGFSGGNKGYAINSVADGLVMYGSDGGDKGYAIDSVTDGLVMYGSGSGDDIYYLNTMANSLWMKGHTFKGNQKAVDEFAGYDSASNSLFGGYDVVIDNDWIIGAALGYSETDINMTDFRKGDGADISSKQLTFYASRVSNSWNIQSMFTYARHNYKTQRDTTLGIAEGDFDGDHFGIRIEGDHAIEIAKNTVITPRIGAEWTNASQDSYTETGSDLALSYDNTSAKRLRSLLGVELQKKFTTDSGVIFIPAVNLGWSHEFKDEGVNSSSRFNGGGGTFTTEGQKISSDTLNVRTSLEVHEGDNAIINVAIEGEVAEAYTGYGAELQFTWKF